MPRNRQQNFKGQSDVGAVPVPWADRGASFQPPEVSEED
jgi:hypothetical protein